MSTNRILLKVKTTGSNEKFSLILQQDSDELIEKQNAVIKLLWEAEQNLIKLKNLSASQDSETDKTKLKNDITDQEKIIFSLKNALNECHSDELINQSLENIHELKKKEKIN